MSPTSRRGAISSLALVGQTERGALARRVLSHTVKVSIGVALLTLGAKARFVLPFTPIPFTLQTMALVLLVLALGRHALPASLAYLAAGLAGAPIFAYGGGLGYAASPTFGYIIGFVAASALGLVGAKMRSPLRLLLLAMAVNVVVYALGWGWLTAYMYLISGRNLVEAARVAAVEGVVPFVAWDALKALVAAQVYVAILRVGARAERLIKRVLLVRFARSR
ncbi:MAG: biotin transporter BioY [Fervidicoccaceae archaeon]